MPVDSFSTLFLLWKTTAFFHKTFHREDLLFSRVSDPFPPIFPSTDYEYENITIPPILSEKG